MNNVVTESFHNAIGKAIKDRLETELMYNGGFPISIKASFNGRSLTWHIKLPNYARINYAHGVIRVKKLTGSCHNGSWNLDDYPECKVDDIVDMLSSYIFN